MKMTEPKQKLAALGRDVAEQILKNKNPAIDIPVRALSNVIFNKKEQTLQLGDKSAQRFFLMLVT